MYDALIIGGGPAGLAAAVYFARQKISFVLLTQEVGGKVIWSSDVENYLGFHLLDGSELVKKFQAHLQDYAGTFEIKEGEPVQVLEPFEHGFRALTTRGTYTARAVLIATGAQSRKLNVPGEQELFGHGVTYCATCDAPLFAGKCVHVIGGGNSAMDAALLAEKYASHVTIVSLHAELAGDTGMKKRCLESKKISVLGETRTTRFDGVKQLTGIGLIGPDGAERVELTDGAFIEIGLAPVSQFIECVAKNKNGEIIVDKQNRTSVPGIVAAGDVTDIGARQIAVAVGEGSKAALELLHYLQTTSV